MSGDVTAASRGEIRSPRAVFAERFAQLHAAAGNPTLRRVATLAEQRMRAAAGKNPNSPSAQRISDWKAGRNVPARFESLLPVVLTLADLTKKRGNAAPAVLLDPQEWRRLWTASNSWTPADPEDIACPYPGLQPYRSTERDSFFGRRRATEELVDLVRTVEGIVVLVGASGAGKSSLLAAGLAATLAAPPDNWGVLSITPGSRPRDTLAEALAAQEGTARLLIVDQFEELFTVCADEHERDAFLADLDRLATDRAVVLALRADFYARCLDYPVLQESLEKRSYLLGPMRIDELAAAVTGPAEHAGLELEPGLDELVITELCGLGDHEARQSYDPGALPLLSHVMAATWQHRERRKLTLGGYRKAGGVVGSVAATAEQAWSELSDAQQEAAKDLLLGLVTVAKDSRDTRRIASRPALLRRGGDPDAAAAALEVLSRARLVTLDADSVFLTHEIVLDAWPRLRTWIEENRVGYLVRQRLESDAAEWDSAGRDPELLYGGARLQTAADHAGPATEGQVHDFLHASRSAHRRSRLRNSSTKALLALAGVILLVFGLAAYTQTRIAEQQRNERNFAAVLVEAQRLRESDPSLAAQLLMVAERMKPGDETVYTNLLGTQSWPLARSVAGHTEAIREVVRKPGGTLLLTIDFQDRATLWDTSAPLHPARITDLPGVVADAEFGPGDGILAVSSRDDVRLVDIRDIDAPKTLSALPGEGPHYNISISADGRVLAAGGDRGITLWDVSTPQEPKPGVTLAAGENRASNPRFSTAGRMLAVTTFDSSTAAEWVQLWEIDSHQNATQVGPPLSAATELVQATTFSPDGEILAIGSGHGSVSTDGRTHVATVQLWRVTAQGPTPISGPVTVGRTALESLEFGADGRTMVVGTDDSATLWNIDEPSRPEQIGAPLAVSPVMCRSIYESSTPCGGGPTSLAIDPHTTALYAGGMDGALRVWSLPPALVPSTVENGLPPLFDAHGKRMAVVASPDRVDLFDTGVPGSWKRIGAVAVNTTRTMPLLSPDGNTLLAIGHYDLSLAAFDLTDPRAPRPLGDWRTALGGNSFAIASDWTIAATNDDTVVRLWDMSDPDNPEPEGKPIEPHGQPLRMQFSIDGRLLVVTTYLLDGENSDFAQELWDLEDPERPYRLDTEIPQLSNGRNSLVFADDHTMVVTNNEIAQFWDVGDPRRMRILSDPVAMDSTLTKHVRYSAQSGRAVIVGHDNRISLWDMRSTEAPRRIGSELTVPAYDAILNAQLLPGSDGLLISGDTLHLWDLNVDTVIARICDVTGDLLTPEIWQRHLPDLPYAPPCD
ncbi:WD40 repeat domain-containing protein [Nocardia puris]|uniref:WD40 repeat protein n=1 Tax=Nocardia puris TaxID=208602 RepID=A0A366DFH1_9NOCA|nr:WD40 repeat domain-containing protein [Nocardia puris]RBO88817.1 WD40 repeat protein [Nocardia puris]